MAQVMLRGCCKFCASSSNFKAYGSVTKKTKLRCHHEDNDGDLKPIYGFGITHENGSCEHFQWGSPKKYSIILKTFNNMQKEG